jgi:hypothetical protein
VEASQQEAFMHEPAIRTIVAVTSEDDRLVEVRERGLERANREHATLILYDLSAGSDPLESPLPTAWSAEGTAEAVPDRLGPEELEAAGRSEIARQVREARRRGVDAWGWLPDGDDEATLFEYAAGQPGPLVVVPTGDLATGSAAGVRVDVVGAER